jgi:CHAD domain-containing protein
MRVVTLGSELSAAEETGPFAAEHVGRLLRRLAYQAGRAAKTPHASDVHDLRVAIRRFTQALAAFDSCFPAQELKRVRRRLKRIMDLAGDVRDCDIAIELLSKSKANPTALVALFCKRRKDAERELADTLRRWSQRHSYRKWRAALEVDGQGAISHDLIGITAAQTLEPMLREFVSLGKKALRQEAAPKKIHRFRIAVKKLRYTFELFAPVYGTSLDGWLERIKALQAVLGTISDCETVRMMVERHGSDRGIESSFQRRVRRKLSEFRRGWADAFTDPSMQRVIGQLSQQAPRKSAAQAEPSVPEAARLRAAHA